MSGESSISQIAEEVTEALIQQLRANPSLTARLDQLNIGDRRVRLDSNTSYRGGETNVELKRAIERVVDIVLKTGLPSTYSHSVTTSGFESGRTSTATLQPETDELVIKETSLEDKDQKLMEKQGASALTARKRARTKRLEISDEDHSNT